MVPVSREHSPSSGSSQRTIQTQSAPSIWHKRLTGVCVFGGADLSQVVQDEEIGGVDELSRHKNGSTSSTIYHLGDQRSPSFARAPSQKMFLEVLVPLPGEMAILSRPDSHKNRSTSSSFSSSSCLLYQLSSSNIFDSTGDQTTKPTGRSYNIEYLTLSSLLFQLSSSNIFDSKGDLTTEPTGRSYNIECLMEPTGRSYFIEYHCITLNSLINLVVAYDTSSLKRKQLVIDGDVESNPGPISSVEGYRAPIGRISNVSLRGYEIFLH